MTDNTIKSWIEERRAALAHVLKHPHPDPAAEWAQTALNALEAVIELHKPNEIGECPHCGHDSQGSAIEWPCPTVQAIGGEIND